MNNKRGGKHEPREREREEVEEQRERECQKTTSSTFPRAPLMFTSTLALSLFLFV